MTIMKREHVKREDVKSGPRRWRLAVLLLITFHVARFTAHSAHAQPTQEDVFRSIQDNVGGKPADVRPLLMFGALGAAVVLLVVVVNQRRQRQVAAPPLNNAGRLAREVTRDLPLRAAELRQLKALAEQSRATDQPVSSPLTFLLCPSLLEKTVEAQPKPPSASQRKALAHLNRKLGQR
jgi:hypothetical protein